MPISNSYPKGVPVEDQDLFVGTKAYSNRTVNYTAQGVADYLNINSKVAIGGQMSFQFTVVPNIPKTIAFEGGLGNNTAFSAITKLIVSAIDVSTANITIFLNYLNNSQILLAQQNQPNFFGHYRITGYTQIGTSAFYELDLDFIGGNGTIIDKQYYDLVSFVLSTGLSTVQWGDITGDIEDQTDLIDYISSQITIPSLDQVATVGNEIIGKEFRVRNNDDTNSFIYEPISGAILWTNNGSTSILTAYSIQISNDNSGWFNVFFDNSTATLELNRLFLNANNLTEQVLVTFRDGVSGDVAFTSDITIPTLAEVLVEGNTSTEGMIIDSYACNGDIFLIKDAAGDTQYRLDTGEQATIDKVNLTQPRNYSLPDKSGTFAMLDDIVQIKTSSFTALNNQFYTTNSATITVTDPTPESGKGYIVYVVSGTTTIGGVGYTAGDLIYRYYNGTSWVSTNMNASSGVASVGLTMPSAFIVTNSPITSSGDIAVTGAGLVSQYVRGDGTLANFPVSTGGGASLSFYLNGSVSQGTFGGVAFREMDRTPILGAGTDFTINTNGYIQSFITDAGVPNLLEIPAGNWNFETYFSASSGGGSPSFYVELYKWNGTTLSLIASSSANPEGITNGTVTDLYVSALAVPQTTLLATDRLAVRIYVNNSGRTIKLHTEDNNLCQVITTFSTGITALNGLTAQVQNLAVGTSGTDFGISSTSATHTFNLPSASATNRGALLAADWTKFNNKMNAAQLAMLTANDAANNTTTPVVLTGHTFTIPAGKTAEITAIMMFTTALATVGAIYGIRVANPTGANGNVIGTSFITVGVSSAPSAGAFQDGDNFNVGANSNSFSSVTGTAATATNNNPANLIATIRNLSTNTSATITIEFASEVGGTDIIPQLGTSANCKILN